MEEKNKKKVLKWGLILTGIFILISWFGYNRYSNLKTELNMAKQNNKALADSVRVSKNKIGQLEYSKNILIAEKKNLKDLNKELYDEVRKEKGKVREIVKIVSVIKSDTVYIKSILIEYPDGTVGLQWNYDTIFNAQNDRHIGGISKFKLDTLGNIIPLETMISKDEIRFNLVTGLKENNGNIEIFVRSDYPNLVISQLDGAIVDPAKHPVLRKFTKVKRFGIGPYIGVGAGYNMMPSQNIGLGFQIGFGVHYSILRF